MRDDTTAVTFDTRTFINGNDEYRERPRDNRSWETRENSLIDLVINKLGIHYGRSIRRIEFGEAI